MKRTVTFFKQLLILNSSLLIIASCSVQKQIAKSAQADVLDATALQTAHVGISIFDPANNKYLYNYQGDKYFVPASNIKLPTCYAAMKYLGDSISSFHYFSDDTAVYIMPTGDPTFLHPDFVNQTSFDFLSKISKKIYFRFPFGFSNALGNGWSWNDYNESYMAERSIMPIYGNISRFFIVDSSLQVIPKIFKDKIRRNYFNSKDIGLTIQRNRNENYFNAYSNQESFKKQEVPFIANSKIAREILEDTLHKKILLEEGDLPYVFPDDYQIVYSQKLDSVLKITMHRSDNFFAEQLLLASAFRKIGVINEERMINYMMDSVFRFFLPQKPRWADGSGLSRYNLFTPQDFVAILNKMKNEFGMERLKVVLPTGGEGTISSYYKADSGYIYGKTGTLSGVVAFSGFLYTKKGKLLIFSTLVNNHQATATEVRRAIEKFLQRIRNNY